MNASSTKGSPYLTLALGGLVLLGVLAYGWVKRTTITEALICRVCAANLQNHTEVVFGIPVRSRKTGVKQGKDTTTYFDRYLGYPHAHEWTGIITLSTSAGRSPFMGTYGPYPMHQRDLTLMGLKLVAASGLRDPRERRRYFEAIIRPADDGHYRRVKSTAETISSQFPHDRTSEPTWQPSMDGVVIPDYVRAGELVPEQP